MTEEGETDRQVRKEKTGGWYERWLITNERHESKVVNDTQQANEKPREQKGTNGDLPEKIRDENNW